MGIIRRRFEIMKKTPRSKSDKHGGELKPEYGFDYRKAKPNRFAGKGGEDRTVVELDADVAVVFSTAKTVNKAFARLDDCNAPKGKVEGPIIPCSIHESYQERPSAVPLLSTLQR